MRSCSALVIDGAHLKSMSAMPMPAVIVPISGYCASAASHFVESVPSRLYGVSKSNFVASANGPAPATTAPAARATPANDVPDPTAPASAVIPVVLRNALRLNDMRVLLMCLPTEWSARKTERYYTRENRDEHDFSPVGSP